MDPSRLDDLDSPFETAPGRRGFLRGFAAVSLALLAFLPPFAAGLLSFLAPLRKGGSKGRGSSWARVTHLHALPADGAPRRFPVLADRFDAWSRVPRVPVGAVFLRRVDDQTLEAVNAICPHAGCLVDYAPPQQGFLCPCHNSTFALDGRLNDPNSPSPRALDTLEVEIRNGTEVWVRFQNFRTGTAEKRAIS